MSLPRAWYPKGGKTHLAGGSIWNLPFCNQLLTNLIDWSSASTNTSECWGGHGLSNWIGIPNLSSCLQRIRTQLEITPAPSCHDHATVPANGERARKYMESRNLLPLHKSSAQLPPQSVKQHLVYKILKERRKNLSSSYTARSKRPQVLSKSRNYFWNMKHN